MKIAVCIDQIATVSTSVDRRRAVLDASEAWPIEHARSLTQLEAGLIHLCAVGPPAARRALRKGLAMGADAAVHLKTPDFVRLDACSVAEVLASHLREASFDLVLFGERGDARDGALLCGMVAGFLDRPYSTGVVGFSGRKSDMKVTRHGPDGMQTLRLRIPCMVSCCRGAGAHQIPSLQQVVAAGRKSIEVHDVKPPDSRIQILERIPRRFQPSVKLFDGDAAEAVSGLTGALREEGLLG